MADSCLQFLDGNYGLVAGAEKQASERWNLKDWGVDYNIVAVCGQPGSGKSTLANALFGTQFPVLGTGGEQSTTKGIWISTAAKAKILAMDAEIATKIPNKSYWNCWPQLTTFTAATSSVLVFNVQKSIVEDPFDLSFPFILGWIYKTYLVMLGQRHKTMILFTIRDCRDEVSKESLTNTLNERIRNAWANAKKPEDLKNRTVDDFFDYDVVMLPSKIESPNEFGAAVDKLRGRFVDRHNPDYLFKPNYWKAVSVDRIVPHLASIKCAIDNHWSVLGYEKFAFGENAPTINAKQKYAAEKRCCLFEGQYKDHVDGFYDMAIHHAYNEFMEAIKPTQKKIDAKGMEDEYLEQLLKCQRNAMAMFNTIVEHHQSDIYEEKRVELRSKCTEKITSMVREQMAWSSSGLVMQLVVDLTLQRQENTIQERVQQEVERRMKEAKLIAAQTKTKLDEQAAEISHLKSEIAENDGEINEHMARIDALEAANGEKRNTISALKATNDEKDTTISVLKAEKSGKDGNLSILEKTSNEKDDVISTLTTANSMLATANSEKDGIIAMLKAANEEKDEVISALNAANRLLEATNSEKDEAISTLKATSGKNCETISILEAANSEKGAIIVALETEAEAQDELAAAWKWDISKLRAVIDRQDTAIDKLSSMIRRQETVISEQ
ncbi:root hair defective 3 GTP-binding protein-domain-containing protein [Thamnocephalis sphaerospora]|uniref:Root hair defective 3 GTP-binding protein-domain-containing protein n=1 Tax=Thamnocephalis sphaerospora TaxID=78915 RepID=A0A4P9XWM6_9FUNG|nr:root hair defective 3 GTP-binding protein-domain-containing protein [Thamnocephalis sphaerospora]|eukprot:RKP10696.1 root hair defective 3 GTP-binding protein-domain-containing protein [Thamnocephalis sphaerospora]